MGSTTCSDPGFAVLQPSFRLGEQKRPTFHPQQSGKIRVQPDKHWHCFEGILGETAERRRASMGLSERCEAILSWNWGTGKRQILYTFRGIVHPNSTGQDSNGEPLALFSAVSSDVPALVTLCCCSACEAVFPSVRVPSAFLRVSRASRHVPRASRRVPRASRRVARASRRVPRAFLHVPRVLRAFLRAPRAFLRGHVPFCVLNVIFCVFTSFSAWSHAFLRAPRAFLRGHMLFYVLNVIFCVFTSFSACFTCFSACSTCFSACLQLFCVFTAFLRVHLLLCMITCLLRAPRAFLRCCFAEALSVSWGHPNSMQGCQTSNINPIHRGWIEA